MQPDSEDDAWRSIVENYGDRADLDPTQSSLPKPTESDALAEDWPDEGPTDDDWVEERFVPPPPPPVPRASRDRLAAWIGIFGSPTILLVCLVFSIHLPRLIGYGLVAGFVGGFLYLVMQMPSGPRDPGDDGARL